MSVRATSYVVAVVAMAERPLDTPVPIRAPAALVAMIDRSRRARQADMKGVSLTRSDEIRTLLLEALAARGITIKVRAAKAA